ncbi:MAG TPA: ATP-binding cassette domain-containing protein [Deltaproteobacteria bacterium]|nr:ATP-binding cassette domain-containing protein [Deltaproteobacteria bacterium]
MTETARPSAVTITGVSFSYGQRRVLEELDLDVLQGSYCGIVGSNGSGKTTLAYLIAGIFSPCSGTIDTHELRTGLVLSNPANQVVSLVVGEDIAFGPENMGLSIPEITSRIEYALDVIHCSHLRDALISSLSGGQLAKIAFAGQLALDVDVLVLDEGTVMLDPLSRRTVLETIRELNASLGKTIIHISHRIDDLETADRVVVLEEGRISRSSGGVFELARQMGADGIAGIELGSRLLYRTFLFNAGIDEEDLSTATQLLSRTMQGAVLSH